MYARHRTVQFCPKCGGAILRGMGGGFFCCVCGFEINNDRLVIDERQVLYGNRGRERGFRKYSKNRTRR